MIPVQFSANCFSTRNQSLLAFCFHAGTSAGDFTPSSFLTCCPMPPEYSCFTAVTTGGLSAGTFSPDASVLSSAPVKGSTRVFGTVIGSRSITAWGKSPSRSLTARRSSISCTLFFRLLVLIIRIRTTTLRQNIRNPSIPGPL